ncbi:MAG: GDSL-type esterase/lipase family protein [Elusimicrobia bacterium]|nr:GDSL-type esterase/lipase family protein [Elusimicrobiota bacterium]
MIPRDERLKASLLGILLLAAVLPAAELLVRAAVSLPREPYPPGGPYGGGRGGKDGLYVYDPLLFWKPKPDARAEQRLPTTGEITTVRTNSLGLRSHEFPLRRTKAHYWILALGNSPVWGEQVNGEETFPSVLEDILSARTRRISVEALNAGVPGYSTFQARELERRLLKDYRFDLVIISIMGADWFPAGRPDKDLVTGARSRTVRGLLSHSALYRYLRGGFWPSHRFPEYGPHNGVRVPVRPDYEDNLTDMVRMAQLQKADVVLLAPMPICTEESCLPHDPRRIRDDAAFRRLYMHMKLLEPQYREAMRRVAVRTGALFLDLGELLRDIPAPDSYYADASHPNAAGHRWIAEALAPLARRLMRDKSRRLSDQAVK